MHDTSPSIQKYKLLSCDAALMLLFLLHLGLMKACVPMSIPSCNLILSKTTLIKYKPRRT